MAIVYSNALKHTRMEAVVTALGASGKLVIGTSALSGATGVLATVPLDNPAGVDTNGVLTLTAAGMTAVAIASGTAAKAELRDGSDNVIASGLTVGVGSGDVQLATTTVTADVAVTISSASITHG